MKLKYSRAIEEPLKLQNSSFSKNVFGKPLHKINLLLTTKFQMPLSRAINFYSQ